jgi:hypothetical protein
MWDQYHVPLVRTQLTQNIATLMPVIMEEIKISFTAEMPLTDGTLLCSFADEIGLRLMCGKSV